MKAFNLACLLRVIAVALVALVGCARTAAAEPVRTEHVEAELVAERTAITPGTPLTVALRLKLAPGWHTYWQNPGDSGLPTTLAWKLPDGVTAGSIQWPAPQRLPAGPLMNYGYEGEVLHLVDVMPSASLSQSPVELAARAEWLVCRETCIPEGADLKLVLPVGHDAAPDPKWSARIAQTRAELPKPLRGWDVSATGRGQTIELRLKPVAGAADPGDLQFFAFEPDRIEPARSQTLQRTEQGYLLALPVSSAFAGTFGNVAGVITSTKGLATPQATLRAATIDVPLAGSVVAGPKPEVQVASLDVAAPAAAAPSLAFAIALALAGGLLLNLMPCVFPVLSLKVLGFARHHDSKATLHAEAVAFAAGVLITFVALGLALSGLRAAGEQLGWGFQLQSPAVVTALAMLFFVLALNLSGVFEFGQLAPASLAGWTSKNRTLDAFASGVLAVVIASPCTAPFMGAALGYALAGTAVTTLLVFVALGVGMALPYVLLAWFPAWRKRLPRSGAWLARVKQLLAFPLYGTVIWLAWVLGVQRDNDAVLRLMVALLALGFALWAWHIVRTGGARAWNVASVVALLGGAVIAAPLFGTAETAPAAARASESGWSDYSAAKVAELQSSGRTVFVDFTAAWCVTCQVNKRLVLQSSEIREAFRRGDIALLRADWTRRDANITAALAALGRNGVPVYVVYRPGQPPQLLPEILSRQVVLDALAG
ncbi:MAG TPA: thioredoxin family protein [Casimicrobiaceae bacterium]|nr:thioredoxin family protein [Casimicrobiaceae bacterium]